MRLKAWVRRPSIRTRLISSYLVILAIGGLVTSLVGSWIVSSTIMTQAQRSMDHDLATARAVYDEQLNTLRLGVQLAAAGSEVADCLGGRRTPVFAFLERVRRDMGFDFLTLTDGRGRVVIRVPRPQQAADDVSGLGLIHTALSGSTATSTEVLSAEFLRNEDSRLAEQARFRLARGLSAQPIAETELTDGMALMAAAPVRASNGTVLGSLYAGKLLNRNFGIVDRVSELVMKDYRFQGKDVGSVTIFQGGIRISTTVRTASGERALGTLVSAEVASAVLQRGQRWRGRAFVLDDWYLTVYEPIRNHDGRVIGMLYVGSLERAYTSVRNRVIFSFFAIATAGFILIILITYTMIRSITRPIGEMVEATRHIAAGRFDQPVQSGAHGEIAVLAESFNSMQQSLRQMRADLEEWGRTLEEKVRQRTEELVAMHDRVAQSARLASLGELAAGVAHEINNPLGGVMALTALALEDLPKDDPNRADLEEVLRQAQRCRDIVKGLLEFSRRSEAHTELCDVNRVLQDTLSLVAKQALFFNVKVVEAWQPDLPPVMADKSQLQQVFMNVLLNSVQAMEERGTVTITTRGKPAGGIVEIEISDTGCGIPPEHIDRIFDPFYTTKASNKGTGLGLSIAYGIITEHHGNILVSSEVGKGSTFTIRLPAALAQAV